MFGWLLVRLYVLKQYNSITTLFIDGEGLRRHKMNEHKRKKMRIHKVSNNINDMIHIYYNQTTLNHFQQIIVLTI